ncbi:hypothetical protein CHS0354_021642 [Potamilus streckersoni]|uniref:Ribosomal RNA large subunit methyltransferase K/L-like methyltransferase domain-containing protein n=1 Tax=Potamilus streckersoni TaxID=2493646 RepID=A0AAE0SNU7_9BIVA|nr:hypothetical protein CHS0354_021642 [Potamilus streckersoni]
MEFYCTCGRGTEKFTHRELLNLFGLSILAEKIEVTDGKVYFSLETSYARDILQLKTVERIFVKVLHCKSDNLDRRNLKSSVMKLIPDHVIWSRALATWKSVQDFTIAESPPGKRLRVKENSKEIKFSPYSHNLCTWQIVDEGDKSSTHRIGISNDRKDENISRCNSNAEILYCDNSDNNFQSGVSKLYDKESEDKKLTFRISMKAAGIMGKNKNNQMLVKELARKVSQFLDIHVDLRDPDLEICIHLNDNFLTIGIPLTRQPLSQRSYILHNGLRSTVAWIMADLCEIEAGEMVLDPMCGKGSILIEAARTNQSAYFLGCDINSDQLKFARTNVDFAGANRNVQIVQADALNLPLPDNFLDCIVMDAPFGVKHKTQLADLSSFYCSLLLETSRLLKNGGRAVVLTSLELKNFIEKYLSDLHQMDKADFVSETNSITQEPSNILCFSHCKSKDLISKCCQTLPQSRHVTDANNSPTIKAENGNDIESGYFRTAPKVAVCHSCTESSKEKFIGSERHFEKLDEEKIGRQLAELSSESLLEDGKESQKCSVEPGGHSIDDVSIIGGSVHEHDNGSGVFLSSEIDTAYPVHSLEEASKGYCIEVFHEIHTQSVNNAVKVCTLFIKDQHYIKLGEMDSYILELQNRK